MRNELRFGADSPEVAADVLDHIRQAERPPRVSWYVIGYLLGCTSFVLLTGAALFALGGAVYGVWRLASWMLGWF